jgi:1-deoxy-D-xylulose-5-phosphate synthase
MSERPQTPLLDQVHVPEDLRTLKPEQLRQFADELRAETISAVSVTGGHLGAGLGVVELTVALHYVFNTPDDRLIWDVGHQCYPHKIITGRRDRIRTLRMGGGLSGFTKRSESKYDPFGAAHSSTSISAALGFATANKLAGSAGKAIAVIGDGAMSAGMAYEAMNNAQAAAIGLVVILNDNDMSIAPPVGRAVALSRPIGSSDKYLSVRHLAQRFARKLPKPLHDVARKAEEYAAAWPPAAPSSRSSASIMSGRSTGHDVDGLVQILENVRDAAEGPMLVHVVTKKGKGYGPAEAAADKYHGVQKFDVVSGVQPRRSPARRPIRTCSARPWRSWPRRTPRSWRSPPRCRPAPASTSLPRRIPSARST